MFEQTCFQYANKEFFGEHCIKRNVGTPTWEIVDYRRNITFFCVPVWVSVTLYLPGSDLSETTSKEKAETQAPSALHILFRTAAPWTTNFGFTGQNLPQDGININKSDTKYQEEL